MTHVNSVARGVTASEVNPISTTVDIEGRPAGGFRVLTAWSGQGVVNIAVAAITLSGTLSR